MPDNIQSLMLAVTALAGLTLLVYLVLTVVGFRGTQKGEISADYARDKSGPPPPERIANWGRNFVNLLELPVLFYVLALLHVAFSGTLDPLQTWLAWGFVASRYVHTAIHVTVNAVPLRFLAHRVGFAILVVMWVRFAITVVGQ